MTGKYLFTLLRDGKQKRKRIVILVYSNCSQTRIPFRTSV